MVDSCRWSSACLCVLWSYNKQWSNGIIISYISFIHTSPRHTDLRQLQGSRDKKQHEPSRDRSRRVSGMFYYYFSRIQTCLRVAHVVMTGCCHWLWFCWLRHWLSGQISKTSTDGWSRRFGSRQMSQEPGEWNTQCETLPKLWSVSPTWISGKLWKSGPIRNWACQWGRWIQMRPNVVSCVVIDVNATEQFDACVES